jgi:hypothetical protein
MTAAIYILCAGVSLACSAALLTVYRHQHVRATRLVMWSSACFAWFAVNNLLMVTDLLVARGAYLAVARAATACAGASTLLFGLVWERP